MKNFAYLMMLVFVLGLTCGCNDGAKTEVVGANGGIPADIQAEYDRVAAEEAKKAQTGQ